RKRQEPVQVETTQPRAIEHLRSDLSAQALDHSREDLLGRQAADEEVRVREEVALEARRLDVERSQKRPVVGQPDHVGRCSEAFALEDAGQLENRATLGQQNRVMHDPPALEELEDPERRPQPRRRRPRAVRRGLLALAWPRPYHMCLVYTDRRGDEPRNPPRGSACWSFSSPSDTSGSSRSAITASSSSNRSSPASPSP